MARFFARFDNASSPNPGSSYNTKTIAASSASAALLRNGLIASRSAVSADIYVELDAANKSGAAGIYFPSDLFVTTNGVLTGSVYTSSLAGIVIPADYATRPTASILSTMTTLVGPANPLDSASVTYDVYLSASNAVLDTLNSIVPATPYDRLGTNPSRTLHSIHHDPNLGYFAWDDFTPGTASIALLTLGPQAGNGVVYITSSTTNVYIDLSWASQYLADTLGTTTIDTIARYNNGGNTINNPTAVNVINTGSYRWSLPTVSDFEEATGSSGRLIEVNVIQNFEDVTIPAHTGAQVSATTTSVGTISSLCMITKWLTGSLSATGTCYPIARRVYAAVMPDTGPGTVPADDPNHTSYPASSWQKFYSEIITPVGLDGSDIVGWTGGVEYWLVRTNGAAANGMEICEYDDTGERTGTACSNAPCGT